MAGYLIAGVVANGSLVALVAPLVVVWLTLTVAALVDLARRRAVRGNKAVWAAVIVVVGTLGPIAYFVFGRTDL